MAPFEMSIKGFEPRLHKIIDEIRKMAGSKFIDSDEGWRGLEPHYSRRIPHPLALATVKRKLETNKYQLLNEMALDMRRVFGNFIRYNYQVGSVEKKQRTMQCTDAVYERSKAV